MPDRPDRELVDAFNTAEREALIRCANGAAASRAGIAAVEAAVRERVASEIEKTARRLAQSSGEYGNGVADAGAGLLAAARIARGGEDDA